MTADLLWPVEDARTHRLPTSLLASHRAAHWEWRVLDRVDNMTGVLGGVTGGSLEMSIHTEGRMSGQVQWAGRVVDMPRWDEIRLQPVYHATFPDGQSVEWPFGVFLPALPRVRHDDGHASATVDLYDKSLILRQARFTYDMGVPVGTDPVAAVRARIREAEGSARVAIEDTAGQLRSPMTWELGTSYQQAVNDMLDAAGFFGLWADFDGAYRSARYVEPAGRPEVFDFADGPEAIYKDGFEVADDWFDTPNYILVAARGNGDGPVLVSRVRNEDPADPLSFPSRGRWIIRHEEGVEATSQEVLDVYAARLMREARTPRTVLLEHAVLPLEGNDRVRFSRSGAVDPLPGVVQSWRVECTAYALMSTTIQEVAA